MVLSETHSLTMGRVLPEIWLETCFEKGTNRALNSSRLCLDSQISENKCYVCRRSRQPQLLCLRLSDKRFCQ